MTKHLSSICTVAFLATVLLFIGTFPMTGAKKNNTQAETPDFAFPKTVAQNADKALGKALAEADWPSAIKALIQTATADNMISQANASKGIAKIDSVASLAPAEWKPAFILIKANILQSVYQSIRWNADVRKLQTDSIPENPYEWSRDIFASQIAERSSQIFALAKNESGGLKEWYKFLENTDYAKSCSMTIEEFLCYRCVALLNEYAEPSRDVIPFFNAVEEATTPTQKCSELRSDILDRLVQSCRERKQYVLLANTLCEKSSFLSGNMKIRHLLSALEMVKGTEGEQQILAGFKEFVNTYRDSGLLSECPFSSTEYLVMLKQSVDRFPKGLYSNQLRNIINGMTMPASEISYCNQYLSSTPIKMGVTLSNCTESWVLVYDYAPFANTDKDPKTKEVAARCRLVKAVRASVSGEMPFMASDSVEIGKLPKGTYVVIPSATSDSRGIYATALNDTWRQPFTVSDISVMTLKMPDATTQAFVVDGSNGRPIEGAQVKVYTRKNYSSPRTLVKTLYTDAKGSVRIKENKFELEAFHNGSKWSDDERYYNTTAETDTTVRTYVQILADKAICHPGDSINAALIAYDSRGYEKHIDAGITLTVRLNNANGEEVASQTATTDRYGRCTVDFVTPNEGLLGLWNIVAYDNKNKRLGSTSIEVADYKAPTFFISVEEDGETLSTGDTVRLNGQVITYSGMPVTGATVKYTVSYMPPMRWYIRNTATFDSSVTTDNNGKYLIELPTSNLKGTIFERGSFTVKTSVTSEAGETQSGPTQRFALGNEYYIRFNDWESNIINITDSVPSLFFHVYDILDKKIEKELSYVLTNATTGQKIAEGSFLSPTLTLPKHDYSSAVYNLKVSLREDSTINCTKSLIFWKTTDKTAPQGTTLWIPERQYTASTGESTVNVTIGSGIQDRWIPAVLSADGEVLSVEWLHIEKDNLTIPVTVPEKSPGYVYNLNYLSNLKTEMRNIFIWPVSNSDHLQVKTETFRDKISAGDGEHWKFRFFRKSGSNVMPVMAVMTDAALNTLRPLNWNFSPRQDRYASFYHMSADFNQQMRMQTMLKEIKYLSLTSITYPQINDYGQGWGLNYRSYFDGGMVYATGAVHNMASIKTTSRSMASMKMAKTENAAPLMAVATEAAMDDSAEEVEMEEQEEKFVTGRGIAASTIEPVELRETECPVAFFLPYLLTDKEGFVDIDFKVPNFNTTWAMQVIGYDENVESAKIALKATASKPIMVSTHAPRFVRTGDVIELTATIFNNADVTISPKCRIELVDLMTGKIIAVKDFSPEKLDVSANRIVTMQWEVPSNASTVGFRAYAEGEGHRDGEQALIPVLPASSPIVESTPFWIEPGEKNIDIKLPKYRESDNITIQYCDNPAWYCLTALPDITTPDSKSITAKIKALYGNAIAYHLISSNANLKEGLQLLLSDKDSEFAAIKSNLEKDGNLKITQLNNTPWVNNAESETLRMNLLNSLLNDDEAKKSITTIFDEIKNLQHSDGGWSWCPDMKSSSWVTRSVLSHMAMIEKAGASSEIGDSREMISSAIKYVDKETLDDYHKYYKKNTSLSYLLDWLLVRSSFASSYLPSGNIGKEMETLAEKARKDIASEWKEMGIGQKSKAALVLWRSGNHKIANEILESLHQYASESPEKGMWFDNLSSGWGSLAAIQTTTLVLNAFTEIQPDNKTTIDKIRQWLVLSRQYQDWGSNTYTVETVNSILTSGDNWTGTTVESTPVFKLNGKKLQLPKAAKLTGAFTMTLDAKDASKKTLAISRDGKSPAWGGVVSQYEMPISEVKPVSVDELSIKKSIVALVEGANGEMIPKEGISLHKGMKVRVTLFITSGSDMDYVAVTDERSACLEPADQLSSYAVSDGVWFYREVRDANTNLYFERLPKGTHVVSYDCYVSQDGEFSCGIATAQSQYSPTTVAHSDGTLLQVGN